MLDMAVVILDFYQEEMNCKIMYSMIFLMIERYGDTNDLGHRGDHLDFFLNATGWNFANPPKMI